MLNWLGRILAELGLSLSRQRMVDPGHGLMKKRAQRSCTKVQSKKGSLSAPPSFCVSGTVNISVQYWDSWPPGQVATIVIRLIAQAYCDIFLFHLVLINDTLLKISHS